MFLGKRLHSSLYNTNIHQVCPGFLMGPFQRWHIPGAWFPFRCERASCVVLTCHMSQIQISCLHWEESTNHKALIALFQSLNMIHSYIKKNAKPSVCQLKAGAIVWILSFYTLVIFYEWNVSTQEAKMTHSCWEDFEKEHGNVKMLNWHFFFQLESLNNPLKWFWHHTCSKH